MSDSHMSSFSLEGAINFRDMGRYYLANGRKIKQGLLFRSGALHELNENDRVTLRQKGVHHILDYRDKDEVMLQPDRLWPTACYKNIPANPSQNQGDANLANLSIAGLEHVDIHAFMITLYRHLPFNNAAYQYLIGLLQQSEPKPLIQHCAIGKDRTGIGAALVLFILGADFDLILQDYLLTEQALAPYRERILSKLEPQCSANALAKLQYAFSAKPEFIEAAYDAILVRYQSIEQWLWHEFGLTKHERNMIQNNYLID